MTDHNFGRTASGARCLALGALAFLAACNTTPNTELDTMEVAQIHPITVDRYVERLDIPVAPSSVALLRAERERVAGFAKVFQEKGYGELSILTPSGTPNATAGLSAVAEISQILRKNGLAASGFRIIPYRPEVDDPNPPVMLTFARAVATGPECGNFTRDFAHAPRNRNTPNFGCATQRNLAAMISDPRDLIEPRPLEPADMNRRQTVFESYRQGETTTVERGDEDSGTVSDVDE